MKKNTDRTARREAAIAGLRRTLTKMVLWSAALEAFRKANDEQKQTMVDVGLRTWALAKLNPEKTKQIKSMLNPIPPSVKERLAELRSLHEDGLITEQEYDARKAEILRDV